MLIIVSKDKISFEQIEYRERILRENKELKEENKSLAKRKLRDQSGIKRRKRKIMM